MSRSSRRSDWASARCADSRLSSIRTIRPISSTRLQSSTREKAAFVAAAARIARGSVISAKIPIAVWSRMSADRVSPSPISCASEVLSGLRGMNRSQNQ